MQASGDNPLIFKGEAELVQTQEALLSLIGRLREAGSFAYDSEFIGELNYLPKLCLIQIATSQLIALVDPLAEGIDLKPFWQLLADPAVEKIMHAGQQDTEPVLRHLGQPAQNVFDTQVCAGFVGMSYPSALSKIVKEVVGVRLGKGLTFTHWDQRPLSAHQLRYAANDVRYLPALRDALGSRLASLGHEAWAKAECDAHCDVGLYRFDPQTAHHRVRGAGSLSPQGLNVIKELLIWRDEAARLHDVPPRAFLKDEILLDLARSPVKGVERLDRVRGLPRPVEQAHGARIVEATKRGLARPIEPADEMQLGEESPTDRHRADALWALVQCICFGRTIDPDLVTSRQEIGRLGRQLASGLEPEGLRLLKGWRFEAVTRSLLEMIKGTAIASLQWEGDSLICRMERR